MSEIKIEHVSWILSQTDSMKVVLTGSSSCKTGKFSGEEAVRIWDFFQDLYELEDLSYEERDDGEYRLFVDYRHPMDDEDRRMIFRGYVAE